MRQFRDIIFFLKKKGRDWNKYRSPASTAPMTRSMYWGVLTKSPCLYFLDMRETVNTSDAVHSASELIQPSSSSSGDIESPLL